MDLESSIRKEVLCMFWQGRDFTELTLSQIYEKLNKSAGIHNAKEYKPVIMEIINDLILDNL